MMAMDALIVPTERGLYCPRADFHIDPWREVERAVITHAHVDHARPGSSRYVAARASEPVMRQRLGADVRLQLVEYAEVLVVNGVRLSLHPAGHILGSAQVRLEHKGRVAVVSGDYKRHADPTCAGFEVVPCHLFVTETTFGLPIYRWPEPAGVSHEINAWWRANADEGRPSVVFAYALGKAQRVLSGLDPSIGLITTHGAVASLVRAYRAGGVVLPVTNLVSEIEDRQALGRAIVLAPPSAQGTPWMRRFPNASTGFASGWMRIRGTRRRGAYDRGFVLSDHADWPSLMQTIRETGAQEIWTTHGYSETVARWLNDQGWLARAIPSQFQGEAGAMSDAPIGPEADP